MSVHLRYYDTNPMHRHLWAGIDPRFADIAGKFAGTPDAPAAREFYLTQRLPGYAGHEPVLLIYHVGETYVQGEQQGMYRQLSRAEYLSWGENARQKVFILFVSGGGQADLSVQEEQLPVTHCYGWPGRVGQETEPELTAFVQDLIQQLEAQPEQRVPQVNWQLAITPSYSQEQEAWLDCQHDLTALWRQGPASRNAARERLAKYASSHPLPQLRALQTLLTEEGSAERPLQSLLQACEDISLALEIPLVKLPTLAEAPCSHPPQGFRRLLWIDDTEEPELLQQLRSQGYLITTPMGEPEQLLSSWEPGQILICDYQLQTENQGLVLMQSARQAGLAVIGISRRPRKLPAGVCNACGIVYAELAGHLHRQLWQLAREAQVSACIYRCQEEVFLY